MVPPEMQVVQAEMDKVVRKVPLVHLARLAPQVMLALMARKEKMVN
jgi:hypothetical protein